MDAAWIVLVLAATGINLVPTDDGDVAVHHTVYAGQGWSPERYEAPPAAPTYDRYQAAPTGSANGVSPPPSITDRASTAASETVTTIREGVEAGFEAASQQFYDSTKAAGQGFAKDTQNWVSEATNNFVPPASDPRYGSTAASRGKASNPFAPAPAAAPATPTARNGMAPPPWTVEEPTTAPTWGTNETDSFGSTNFAAPPNTERMAALGAGPVQTQSGWTSVRSELPPPALAVPQLSNPGETSLLRSSANAAGPSFAAAFQGNSPSGSAAPPTGAPSQPAANGDDGWALGWGTNQARPASIGRYETAAPANAAQPNSAQSSAAQPGQDRLAAEPATIRSDNNQQTAAPKQAPGFDPWGDNDPWADPVKSPGAPQSPANGSPQQPATGATVHNPGLPIGQPAVTAVNQQQAAPASAPTSAAVPPTNAAASPAGPAITTAQPAPTTATNDNPPWMPLLVVSLSLAGSIGANLFLGWSYIDARQKYRTLVQKTANKFRRAAAAA
jgi:hypothetical protein